MARKRFRWVALAAVAAATGGAAHGQGTASAATVAGAASPRAAIWAATADYVYKDDHDLAKIRPELLKTIKSSSIQAFNLSVDAAVALEKKQLPGKKHVLKFQGLVKTVQEQLPDPNDASALAKAIVAKLDDNDQRMADPARTKQLKLLEQHLNQLAASTSPPEPAATVAAQPAADNPMNQVAAPPAGAPAAPETTAVAAPTAAAAPAAPASSSAPAWASWLALVLSGLSFAGMMLLFRKQNQSVAASVLPPVPLERVSRQSSRKETNVSWDEMRKFVGRQLDERLNPAVAPAAAPAPATAATAPAPAVPPLPDSVEAMLAPLPVAPAASRQRTQYANEAPFNNTFPARALSDQPGTYSMFAIVSSEQQPEQGTFAVTGNLASHVRDHRSVLEPVCEYVGGYPLGSESRVITVEPGHVRRRGDDWEVVQRAKVRFE